MVLLLASVVAAPGQTVALKDGRVLAAASVKRTGDRIALESASGARFEVAAGEIARIDFVEPPELGEATGKLLGGKGEDAVALLERLVAAQADFQEIPGNWWALTALRLAQTLESQGRGLEAQGLAEKIATQSIDPNSRGRRKRRPRPSYCGGETVRGRCGGSMRCCARRGATRHGPLPAW